MPQLSLVYAKSRFAQWEDGARSVNEIQTEYCKGDCLRI